MCVVQALTGFDLKPYVPPDKYKPSVLAPPPLTLQSEDSRKKSILDITIRLSEDNGRLMRRSIGKCLVGDTEYHLLNNPPVRAHAMEWTGHCS